jgi:hypothetical protein
MQLEDMKPKFAYTARQLREDNPRRPPDWRYQRAKQLADQLSADRKVAWEACDYLVRRLTELIVSVRQREPESHVHANFPDIYDAYSMHRNAGRARWQWEALIATGQHPEDMSRLVGLPEAAIRTYAALFFDIQSRLCYPALMTELLLDGSTAGNISSNDLDKYWKHLALNMTADHLWPFIQGGESPIEACEKVVRLADCQMSRNALMVAITSPINSMTGEVMMTAEMNRRNLALRRREMEEKLAEKKMLEGRGDGEAKKSESSIMRRMLNGLEMTVSDLNVKDLPAVEVPQSVELINKLNSAIRTGANEQAAKKPQESEV